MTSRTQNATDFLKLSTDILKSENFYTIVKDQCRGLNFK